MATVIRSPLQPVVSWREPLREARLHRYEVPWWRNLRVPGLLSGERLARRNVRADTGAASCSWTRCSVADHTIEPTACMSQAGVHLESWVCLSVVSMAYSGAPWSSESTPSRNDGLERRRMCANGLWDREVL